MRSLVVVLLFFVLRVGHSHASILLQEFHVTRGIIGTYPLGETPDIPPDGVIIGFGLIGGAQNLLFSDFIIDTDGILASVTKSDDPDFDRIAFTLTHGHPPSAPINQDIAFDRGVAGIGFRSSSSFPFAGIRVGAEIDRIQLTVEPYEWTRLNERQWLAEDVSMTATIYGELPAQLTNPEPAAIAVWTALGLIVAVHHLRYGRQSQTGDKEPRPPKTLTHVPQ